VLERAIAKVVQLKEIPHEYFAVSAAGGHGPPPVCGERDQEHSGMTGRLKATTEQQEVPVSAFCPWCP
jgi:hypothetical protein